MRAEALSKGMAGLTPDKQAMAAVVGRLLVLYENATGRLFHDGEVTEAGEVRVLLARTVPDLFDRIERGLRYLYAEGKGEGNW
jgi:hypothetical protein